MVHFTSFRTAAASGGYKPSTNLSYPQQGGEALSNRLGPMVIAQHQLSGIFHLQVEFSGYLFP